MGRNEKVIKKDAIELLGDFDEYITIARDKDMMLAERPEAIEISKFMKDIGKYACISNSLNKEANKQTHTITLVCNGGTTSQLVPLIRGFSQFFYDSEGYWDDLRYDVKFIEIDRDKNITEY